MSSGGKLNRRAFCRQASAAGVTLALAPILSACEQSTEPPELSALESPTATTAPTIQPTATVAPTVETAMTQTPLPTVEATPTTEPQPTATIQKEMMTMTNVALVKTTDRGSGVQQAISMLGLDSLSGKRVLLKPNFNSADPAPGSTHPAVLRSLVTAVKEMGAAGITVGDRSGMGNTRSVMQQLGVTAMAEELGFDLLVFDELSEEEWVVCQENHYHWDRGFAIPRQLLEAECVVQTCNLKTHRFGGHFTLSLKNSVGFAAKTINGDGYNYMSELHSSPHQRRMIAEINSAYTPAFIVMDGVEAFVEGGPDTGKKVESQVVLAGTDRVALDAVGVAILRLFGTTTEVSRGKIFDQEQIARAVDLGLGIDSPERIRFITADDDSEAYADRIREVLFA